MSDVTQYIALYFIHFLYLCFTWQPNTLIVIFSFSYEQQEIALNCGTMLRECARYEALAKIMLYSDDFFNFFRYVEVSTFDIASDAFSTFKVLSVYCVFLFEL